jgi:hypothetical protein
VENRRVVGGRVVQRDVLYLGEINSSQELAARKSIEVLENGEPAPRTHASFPEDRREGLLPDESIVSLKLKSSTAPTSTMGRVLVGAELVANAGPECLLGRATACAAKAGICCAPI